MVDLLADYLSALESENEIPANAWTPPQDSLEFWEKELNAPTANTPVQLFGKVMARTVIPGDVETVVTGRINIELNSAIIEVPAV